MMCNDDNLFIFEHAMLRLPREFDRAFASL